MNPEDENARNKFIDAYRAKAEESRNQSSSCPNCGYCPHCGRAREPYFYPQPYYAPYPYHTVTCSVDNKSDTTIR